MSVNIRHFLFVFKGINIKQCCQNVTGSISSTVWSMWEHLQSHTGLKGYCQHLFTLVSFLTERDSYSHTSCIYRFVLLCRYVLGTELFCFKYLCYFFVVIFQNSTVHKVVESYSWSRYNKTISTRSMYFISIRSFWHTFAEYVFLLNSHRTILHFYKELWNWNQNPSVPCKQWHSHTVALWSVLWSDPNDPQTLHPVFGQF